MKSKYSNYVIAAAVILVMSQMPVQSARSETDESVRHLSGEITVIDVKQGILSIKPQEAIDSHENTSYRINKNETRVTDSQDQDFMTIEDLNVGQRVILDIVKGEEKRVIKKIVAEPADKTHVTEKTQTTVTTTTITSQ